MVSNSSGSDACVHDGGGVGERYKGKRHGMKDNRHSMSRGIYDFGFTGAVKSSEGLKSVKK